MPLSGDELQHFVDRVLDEDLGQGDVTAQSVIPEDAIMHATLVARQPLVVAGVPIAREVFRRLEPECEFEFTSAEGEEVAAGATIAAVSGRARGLVSAERAALNILQHLSGIATLTRAYVKALEGTGVVLLDTRKTVPGLRKLAKYATRIGGARNHRAGLYDAVLIKDNHIAAAGGIAAAIHAAKSGAALPVEVECDTVEQVEEALRAGADSLLLDNMSADVLEVAVRVVAGRLPLEASGGVTIDNIRAIAATGVDYISVGRITQSAPAVDVGMDILSL